jgi:hypothetical protein
VPRVFQRNSRIQLGKYISPSTQPQTQDQVSIRVLKDNLEGKGPNKLYFPPSRWSSPALYSKLEADKRQPMDIANCAWVSARAPARASRQSSHKGSGGTPKTSRRITPEGSSGNSERCFMIFQPNVCTTQKRWRLATYHKSEETERSFVSSPLQDGEYIESKRCIKERGLHGQIRPDRCILNSFCVPRESKIPKIFISRKKFPVFLSPIRPSNSSESFHKDSATSSNISQINWDQTINLFRRYFDSGQFPDIDDRPFPDNLRSYTEFGLSSQLEEECNKTHSTDRVCWSIGRFRINDSEHTQIQDSEDCQGESSDHQETDGISGWKRACSDYWPTIIWQSTQILSIINHYRD